jgi:plastocyanin
MLRLALIALACVVLAGCGSSDSSSSSSSSSSKAQAASASATVDIRSFKYKPAAVTVKRGGRIMWTNSDDAAHTSTADDRSFDTQTIDRGKAKSVTFMKAGTFAYHCDFHPFMKATVVVR